MAPLAPVRASLALNVRFADKISFLDACEALSNQQSLTLLTPHRFTAGERVRVVMGYMSPTASVTVHAQVVSQGPPDVVGEMVLTVTLVPGNTADAENLKKLVVEARAARTIRFLLAEDNPHIRQMYSRALHHSFDDGEATASILYAGDGLEALQLVERHGPPDLVVCDLAMPVMDGLTFIQKLRADPGSRSVPVLVITAEDQPAMDAAKALGVQGQLHKPVQLTHIVKEVRRILGLQAKDS